MYKRQVLVLGIFTGCGNKGNKETESQTDEKVTESVNLSLIHICVAVRTTMTPMNMDRYIIIWPICLLSILKYDLNTCIFFPPKQCKGLSLIHI